MAEIVYPSGCKPITDFDLPEGELIKRLKTLATQLQALVQDAELCINNKYTPLSHLLIEEFFVEHNSKDVQLLVACCIADLMRVYAPEAPYKDQDQIKDIFLFFTKQLSGLIDQKDINYKRYFYLLENLVYVKSYSLCFEIVLNQEVFQDLFKTVFSILSNNLTARVKTFLVEMLIPLITDSDQISFELLDLILINIIEPKRTENENACKVSKEIIIKTKDTLEPYIKAFLNHILLEELEDEKYMTTPLVYELLRELYSIIPNALIDVMPNLECKLKSSSESDRIRTIHLIVKLISRENSTLEQDYPQLWTEYLGRYYDIEPNIRKVCVQNSAQIILNRKELRGVIEEQLSKSNSDHVEYVRYEVVLAIQKIISRNVLVACKSEVLLDKIMKARILDTQVKIRREAIQGLGSVVRQYYNLLNKNLPVDPSHYDAVHWIRNKMLHVYYLSTIEDRVIVEQAFAVSIIPSNLPTKHRISLLYSLMGTIDEHAKKAFQEIQKSKIKFRKLVEDLIRLQKSKEITAELQKVRLTCIAKLLPDPPKALAYLQSFCAQLRKDPALMAQMEKIIMPNVLVKDSVEICSNILRKWGDKRPGYQIIEKFLNRFTNTLFDSESMHYLVSIITEALECDNKKSKNVSNGDSLEQANGEVVISLDDNENRNDAFEQLPKKLSCEKGLKVFIELIYVYTDFFKSSQVVLKQIIRMIHLEQPYVASSILNVFTVIGRAVPLIQSHPEIWQELLPICRKYARTGTPKQAKRALQCIFVNSMQPLQLQNNNNDVQEVDAIKELVDSFSESLNPNSKHYRTAIVVLGHIAFNQPERFNPLIKNIISRKIVKELLVKEVAEDRTDAPNLEFCNEDELPEDTLCRIEGLKTMSRWLIGLKKDVNSAQKTFRMFNAFIKKSGDLADLNRLSRAEKSWLRLSAGNCMLKICEQDGVGDQYTLEQFFTLSHLMLDETAEVRERFIRKLHKGLNNGVPHHCLSLDFMGFYVLAGREPDKILQEKIKTLMNHNLQRRREYMKLCVASTKALTLLPHVLPDYTIAFSIAVLTHDPNFTNPTDFKQLREIEKCLWFVLEPLANTLLLDSDNLNYNFYNQLISRLKHHKSVYKVDDEIVNQKMWVICDLTLHLIKSRVANLDVTAYDKEPPQIPLMFFQPQNESFKNNINYIPSGFHRPRSRVGSPTPQVSSTVEKDQLKEVTRKRGATPDDSDSEGEKSKESSTNEEDTQEPPKKQTRSLRTRAKRGV